MSEVTSSRRERRLRNNKHIGLGEQPASDVTSVTIEQVRDRTLMRATNVWTTVRTT